MSDFGQKRFASENTDKGVKDNIDLPPMPCVPHGERIEAHLQN